MTEAPKPPKLISAKSSDFKVINADGIYTWVNSNAGTIMFFDDIIEPEFNPDASLNIKTIKRTFTIEIRMTREMYQKVIEWMSGQVKILEEFESNQKKDQK